MVVIESVFLVSTTTVVVAVAVVLQRGTRATVTAVVVLLWCGSSRFLQLCLPFYEVSPADVGGVGVGVGGVGGVGVNGWRLSRWVGESRGGGLFARTLTRGGAVLRGARDASTRARSSRPPFSFILFSFLSPRFKWLSASTPTPATAGRLPSSSSASSFFASASSYAA